MIQTDPNARRPGMPRATPGDETVGRRVVAGAVLLAGVAAGAWWAFFRAAPPAPVEEPAVAPAVTAESPPAVRHPVEASPAEALVEPLPALDASDARAAREATALVGKPAFDELFAGEGLLRRVVATVDNLPRRNLPATQRPLRGATGAFLASGTEDAPVLDEANYARYQPYARLAALVDARAAVAAYQRLYPLAQQAYEELGYPGRYFNDRLVEVIDDLLAAPELDGPVPLKRPNVLYEFADPDLEARPAGQKILIRMGPANARQVKSKLREIRALLATP